VVAKWLGIIVAATGVGAACVNVGSAPAKAESQPGNSNESLATNGREPTFDELKADFEASIQQRGRSMTALYNETCAKCHGANAEGGGAGTPSLNTLDKFDQKWDKPFFDAIKNGVPDMGMEAYGQTLSDEEIWGLVVHLRELQGRALRRESGSPRPDSTGVFNSRRHKFKIEEVIPAGQGLKTPWGIDWLPDGRMLVTNRSGEMFVHRNGSMTEVQNMPPSIEFGQGGLMDVAVHPNYRQNGWVYLAVNDPAKNGNGGLTKIVRGKLAFSGDTATWGSQQTIYEADQKWYNRAGVHFGARIVFDGKGHVFFAIGERGSNMGAQSLETPYGKVMRLKDDGTVPADNPYVNTPGADKAIWTFGHRNQQGLVFDLEGRLWDTEHGPRGGDELNEIVKAANYGWPVVAFSINYNDAPFRTPWPKDGLEVKQPAFRWLPSIGASGLDVVKGGAFPQWRGDLVAGGLAGNNLDRIRTKDGKLVEREELIHGMGRIRDVSTSPQGHIYIAFNQPDRVVRLVPAN